MAQMSFAFTAAGVIIAGAIIHIVAFATDGWLITPDPNGGTSNVYVGLWKFCYTGICLGISNIEPWFEATRVLEAIALVFNIMAIIGCIIFICRKMDVLTSVNIPTERARIIMSIAAIIGGALAMIGAIIFGAEAKQYLHYSFGLCIAGGIVTIIGGVLGLLAKDTDTIPYGEQT